MLVMCLGCGTFVTAVATDGSFEPLVSACPDCEGTRFKHVESGAVVDVE